MTTETKEVAFSSSLKILHWIIAVLVLGLLSTFILKKIVPEADKPTMYMIHKSFGITVLALMFLRVLSRCRCKQPPLPPGTPRWEVILSRAVQHSFYLFLFLMPLSGWIMSTAGNRAPVYFGLFKLPMPLIPLNESLAIFMKQSHKTLAWVLLAFVGLHIAGALKHWLIDRDDVIDHML